MKIKNYTVRVWQRREIPSQEGNCDPFRDLWKALRD
jgi:hypothetical protein